MPLSAADAGAAEAFIIPHTHWEGAVFRTREEYLEVGLPHIVTALYLLKKYPDYRFTLDQMCYVRPFLERYPSEVHAFREFLQQGRLQIVGGTDTMHDNNIPSGESIVRQYLLTKTYFRQQLGYDITTGWALDTFGHNAQMPQILKLAGMKSYWFSRGAEADTPSEFLWQGLDGTQIPAFRLPYGYGIAYGLQGNELEFARLLHDRFDSLAPYSLGPERALLEGNDVTEPEEFVPGAIERFNASERGSLKARFAVPVEFESAVAKRSDRPVVRGEFNPVFQGVYSSRIELKQAMRETERLLTTAEKLSVLAVVAGEDSASSPDAIDAAWEPVLFNEAHDISSGTIVDKVYEDTMRGYDRAQHLAGSEVQRASESIRARINTAGGGVPVVVFNTLGWERTDVAQVDVPFSEPGVQEFALYDSAGTAVPVQVVQIVRNGDGGIRQARIVFVARRIPAMGYAVYHAIPSRATSGSGPAETQSRFFSEQDVFDGGGFWRDTIENDLYRASFDLGTGAMTSLKLKGGSWEALAGAGNVIARERDGGDLWELYGTLGTGLTKIHKPIGPPRVSDTQWSSDFVAAGASTVGPVFSEFHIQHPFGKGQFATRVRLYRGLSRMDIRTELTNQEEFVRYRAVFPTTLLKGRVTAEIAFGAIERPQNAELPAQNWIDYSDARHGVTLINRGIPGNNVSSNGEMMLSLARSAHIGVYDPTMAIDPSDTGLELGKTLTLEYALVPHSGDWRAAKAWRAGLEFNNPLIAQTAEAHSGDLPQRWGLVEASHDNVVVSALKPGREGTAILRVYEAAGRPAPHVHVSFHTHIGPVHEVNLIEEAGAQVGSSADGFLFDLKPFEIKAFSVTLEPVQHK